MPSLGETFMSRIGPLPVWAWAGIGTGGVIAYMYFRNKKKAAAAAQQAAAQNQGVSPSYTGTVPISNVNTQAQPMPIQMGDTFVNTEGPQQQPAPTNPVAPPNPPTDNLTTAGAPTPSPAATSVSNA